jgi:hypothetical protein
MNYNFDKMTNWELDKANFLIQSARKLGMNLQGYGEVAVNQNSGYTYLWCEDYQFTLYMPISCELDKESVYVLWSNPTDGEEIEESLVEFETISDIYRWVELLEGQYN